MYNYFNNLNLNYKLNILVIFNTFVYFLIKYDSLDRNTQTKPYIMSIFGTFAYFGYKIPKPNRVIWLLWVLLSKYGYFGYYYPNPFQIHWLFDYFQVFLHQNRTHPDPGGPETNQARNFVIPERGLISKPEKPDTRKNRPVPEQVSECPCLLPHN